MSCPIDDAAKTQSVLSFLHDSNVNLIREGKLGETRATNASVKDFATALVKDHTDADRKLTDFAKKQSIDLSHGAPADPIHVALLASSDASDTLLRAKYGKPFDHAFVGPQVSAHTLLVKLIEEGLRSTKDAGTKKLLEETRVTVVLHQQQASKLQDQLATTPATPTPIGGGPAEPKLPPPPPAPLPSSIMR
jgi:putative membrane protein